MGLIVSAQGNDTTRSNLETIPITGEMVSAVGVPIIGPANVWAPEAGDSATVDDNLQNWLATRVPDGTPTPSANAGSNVTALTTIPNPTPSANMVAIQINQSQFTVRDALTSAERASGDSALRASISHIQDRIDALEPFVAVNGYVEATPLETEQGYAFAVVEGQFTSGGSISWTAADVDVDIDSNPTSTFEMFVRVPHGVDPESTAIGHLRSNTILNTYPRDADEWEAVTVASPSQHYDYYQMVDRSFGRPIGVSGVEALDSFDMRIAATPGEESGISLLSLYENLPTATSYAEDKMIYVRGGRFYRAVSVAAGADFTATSSSQTVLESDGRETVTGYSSPRLYGGNIPGLGTASYNPDGRILWLLYDPGDGSITFGVGAEAWDNAPGRTQVSTNGLTLVVTSTTDTSRTETMNFPAQTPGNGRAEAGSWHNVDMTVQTSPLFALLTGAWNVRVLTGDGTSDTDFFSGQSGSTVWHDADSEVFSSVLTRIAKVDAEANLNSTNANEILNGLVDARTRLRDVEERTSVIDTEDENVWEPVTASANANGATYGKFMLVVGGDNLANYIDLNYNSGGNAYVAQYAAAAHTDNIGIVWVVSNTPTWSQLRLALRDSDGKLKTSISAEAMSTVPSTNPPTIANLPASGYTARWIASSATHPHSLANIKVGDTLTIEKLNVEHIPVWEGEVSEGLRDRLALSEAQVNSVIRLVGVGPNGLGLNTPRQSLTLTGSTSWQEGSGTWRRTDNIYGMRGDDLISIEWQNLNVNASGTNYSDFAQEGSTNASGSMWLHYRDLHNVAYQNHLGNSTGVARTNVDGSLVDDPYGAYLLLRLWGGPNRGDNMELTTSFTSIGPDNESTTGQFPTNFSLTIRTWRSLPAQQTILSLIQALQSRVTALENNR